MAYVRQRGNQIAIVQGVRDSETKKVEQQILFTLYSKAEALEALGKGEDGDAHRFHSLLETSHPTIKFEWKEIHRGIKEKIEILPETYDYRSTRLRGRFREDMLAFARQIIVADPQTLAASAQLLSENRKELEYLREVIDWRLGAEAEPEDSWNADNAFYWRFATQTIEVPSDIEERAAGLYEKREYERATVAFKLLTGAFEDYAEGYNYLGLMALDQEHLDEAIGHFKKTMEVGRRLFPKRIAKNRWWSDHATRPYMRGLRNLALALNQAKLYDEALAACDQLANECQDAITAAAHRASVYLNTGQWQKAFDAACYIHRISPSESLVAAFAAFELGKQDDSRALFLHAVLNCPRTVAMVMGTKIGRPASGEDVDDHNGGVTMVRALSVYLEKRTRAAQRHFTDLWKTDQVAKYRKELEDVTRRWREDRKGQDRTAFDRMTRMRSWEFATAEFAPRIPSQQLPMPALPSGRSSMRVVH